MSKTTEDIIEKKYFTMQELVQTINKKDSAIRFWESSLGIKLYRNSKNNRIFNKEEFDLFLKISKLHDTKYFTNKGIKAIINDELLVIL